MAMRLVSDTDEPAELHEINVTPFIDVMLVLLIIFMIAAPLATATVPLELPVSTADATPDPQEPILLSLQGDLKLSLGNREIGRGALVTELDRASKGDKQARIFLRADKTVPYGDLMALMDELRQAQYLKVGLVTLDQASPKGPAA
jgi:TonB system transport protein ExbD (group 1)